MKENPNTSVWQQNIQNMNEQELLDVVRCAGNYNKEFVDIVINRLVSDFSRDASVLKIEVANAEVQYQKDQKYPKPNRPLSSSDKKISIVILIVFGIFGFIYVLYKRVEKVKTESGEKHYRFDEEGRKWLLNCVIGYWLGLGLLYSLIQILIS